MIFIILRAAAPPVIRIQTVEQLAAIIAAPHVDAVVVARLQLSDERSTTLYDDAARWLPEPTFALLDSNMYV